VCEAALLSLRWEIAFHGTPAKNVVSIVQDGFRLPGPTTHEARYKCNWGPGIYCSPHAAYSLPYGRSEHKTILGDGTDVVNGVAHMFVVAVIIGRQYECARAMCRRYTGLMGKKGEFDSHVSPCGHEWIVFDERRIIPLCVMEVEARGTRVFRRPESGMQGHGRENLSELKESKHFKYQKYRRCNSDLTK